MDAPGAEPKPKIVRQKVEYQMPESAATKVDKIAGYVVGCDNQSFAPDGRDTTSVSAIFVAPLSRTPLYELKKQ